MAPNGTGGLGDWSLYHNLDQFSQCPEVIFLDFSLFDQVDDAANTHRLYACSARGADWTQTPNTTAQVPIASDANVTYELGWWPSSGTGVSGGPGAIAAVRSLSRQMRWYLTNGHAPTDKPVYLFARFSNAAVGLYFGKSLQNEGTGSTALSLFEDNLLSIDPRTAAGGVAMQFCEDGSDADYVFGIVARLSGSMNLTAQVYVVTPSVASSSNITSISSSRSFTDVTPRISRRTNYTTIQVISGDSCASLASEFGISASDFTKYNSDDDLCSTLEPYQHLEEYNKNTWAWNGCDDIWVGTIICLSNGTAPMPASLSNALCGPQVPGTEKPTNGTALADLNACALNACCDVWGQCGVTSDFCTNTSTGAPGTAKVGTNGCISNCGTDIVLGAAPDEFRSVTYFESYGFGRPCLYMDAKQINTDKYTHIHYAFATLSDEYEVLTGDAMQTYEFSNFKAIRGPKKIVTFGGWDFSTSASTYSIFRDGVTAANRVAMATSIANFSIKNGLDGVDIDWEYPGAPDIPGIPAGGADDGANYLAFLVVLRDLLGTEKSISTAAPSSYWYLKAYPLAEISNVVDYIVFMTYDLHGQWDYGNANVNPGCPTGNCLRSQVNLTETMTSLSMITKAGVPFNQVVVGVSSYRRSFQMASAGCYTENCLFTGSSTVSNAAEGLCTVTARYISDAEIKIIIDNSSRVNYNLVDDSSNINILVYDDIQWVGYMDVDTKSERTSTYKTLQMGGTTDWATDLEDYQNPPAGTKSWAIFVEEAQSGLDPWEEGNRTGNWTEMDCSSQRVADLHALTPQERWDMLDCVNAWQDAIDVWTQIDRPAKKLSFPESIANTYHVGENANCGSLFGEDNCDEIIECTQAVGSGTGPAGYVIWNSLVLIHEAYKNYYNALYSAYTTSILPSFPAYEDVFTPLPDTGDEKVIQVLLDVVGLLGTVGASVYFNDYLESLPSFLALLSKDDAKDGTLAFISAGTDVAKDLVNGDSSIWTADKEDEFEQYMGQFVAGWEALTETAVNHLFNGSDASINTLTKLISNGRFIAGSANGHATGSGGSTPGYAPATNTELEGNITTAFWSYTIPYLSDDTASATKACYNDKLYYLVAAKGYAEICEDTCVSLNFKEPAGLDKLDGTAYGGLTLSVKTYVANGNNNGASSADFTSSSTLDDLYNTDITTPGFIRIPVCSAEIAYTNWDALLNLNSSLSSAANFPCNTPQGEAYCGTSTFVDETSGASPTVSDCQQIAINIAAGGDWTVDSSGVQHQLVQYGTCAFGIQGQGSPVGNVDFTIGNQDIIDIITSSISMYGGDGQVGAKG
ncbi:hypothetical protein VPNG_03014 [Cytospora leucostoma]|uniref:chitinase n=1 Tax=Cytospora leucostoma TaxID=1230097 RepID=A0A423XG85_9PEZI|nr:hypothetical protein VPNG_03014 [Cytospora leucostoma]